MTGIVNEEWRSIDGYVDYQISNIGRVRKAATGRIFKPSEDTSGYLGIGLTLSGVRKRHLVHRLVAHEFIDNPNSMPCIDHINHTKTDNTINNLRWVSRSQNSMNRAKRTNTTSEYKGVSFSKQKRRWRAVIMVDGKNKHIGYVKTEKEAAAAYNKAAIEHFGEYACLDEISDDEF